MINVQMRAKFDMQMRAIFDVQMSMDLLCERRVFVW